MANTYVDSTATADQTDFPFTFPYLKDTHVIVSIDGTETDINDTGTGEFTISTSPSTKVVLGTGATVGASVRIKRNSLGKTNAETALVDYTDGSVLTEKELDDAYLHNFYLSQEAVEGAAGGMALDSTQTNWDAQNKKIVNVGDPTLTGDAANKTYVDTQVSNTVTGSTTAAQKFKFDSTTASTGGEVEGTRTQFTFQSAITLDADTAYTVAIDGVLQEPTVAYTIDADNDQINFTSAPPDDATVVVISRGYSVPVTSGAGTVTSVIAGNGLSGGTITSTGTVSIPTSGGDLNISGSKIGIGGDVDSSKTLKITGDVLINETSGDTQLHILNEGATNACSLKLEATVPYMQFKDTNASANSKLFNIGNVDGKIQLISYNDDLSVKNTLYSAYSDGNVKLDSLPTTDPSTAGYLWNDGGVVSVSGSSGFSGGGTSSYSSGWATSHGVTVANAATLTFTHGLGTADLIVDAYVSPTSYGSDAYRLERTLHGGNPTEVTSTTITYQLSNLGYLYMTSGGVNATTTVNGHNASSAGYVPFTSKYIKLVAIG